LIQKYQTQILNIYLTTNNAKVYTFYIAQTRGEGKLYCKTHTHSRITLGSVQIKTNPVENAVNHTFGSVPVTVLRQFYNRCKVMQSRQGKFYLYFILNKFNSPTVRVIR